MLFPAASNESVAPEPVCLPFEANGMTVSDVEARPIVSGYLIAASLSLASNIAI
jgi:hypothetical protein